MVQQMLKQIPLLSPIEEASFLCYLAVEKVLFGYVYDNVFAMYKIKVSYFLNFLFP